MQASTYSVTLSGIEALAVEVQCQVARGLPAFHIVGLADKSVSEAKERVRASLYAMSIAMPPFRITINLSPADQPKSGNHYDLAIALALLGAMEIYPQSESIRLLSMGALSLQGKIEPVSGVLAAAIEAQSQSLNLICPAENLSEAQLLQDIDIFAPPNLQALIRHLRGEKYLPTPASTPQAERTSLPDMSEVKGHEKPKRALEIAAAGRHHTLFVGAPGAGKSMLASRIPSILPKMTPTEILHTSLVHSAAGRLHNQPAVLERPYFAPHHSASPAAIVGGGRNAGPGEISLAHNGVLFLDELPEFQRQVLETLRQPLETGEVLIARANAHVHYPAKFLLIAAANPCQCGFAFDPQKACSRLPSCREKYLGRISGPLLDRFTLRVEMEPIPIRELGRMASGEASSVIAKRVNHARAAQYQRNGDGVCNEDLGPKALDNFMSEDTALVAFLTRAAERLNLSSRGFYRVIKAARTIADLDARPHIRESDLAEALAFRSLSF